VANYLLVNDIHLSDRAPSSCTDSYLDDLFGLLAETVTLAATHDAEAVIWAGDVFHFKTPGRTSHATVMRAIRIAEAYPCPLWIVPGNHDITNDRLDSVEKTQPLGVLVASGAARILNGWMDNDQVGPHPVYGVPWLQRFDDDTVTEALAGYRRDRQAVYMAWSHFLVVTHAPLYPPGKELTYEFYPAAAWATAMGEHGTGHGTVHYGHVHEPHGIYTVGGVTFSNCGALSRGSLHEHNLTREIQVALWNDDTGQIQHLTVPHRPAAEVFRLKEIEQIRTAEVELDTFLATIGMTKLTITSTEAVVEHIRSLGLEPKLEQILHELLGADR
jgi:DNA repair exonuclease SbcCD nuclease subunit